MKPEKFKQISSRAVFSCPYFSLKQDEYVMPNGSVGNYYGLDIRGSSMVVPVLPNGDLVLVEQHRYLQKRDSLEFPAGQIKPTQDAPAAAAAELREEAGYLAGQLREIGAFAPCNGLSNELCHVFVAQNLSSTATKWDESEELRVVILSPVELERKISSGELWDGMTIASYYFYRAAANNS